MSRPDLLRLLSLPRIPEKLWPNIPSILASEDTHSRDPNFHSNTVAIPPTREWLETVLCCALHRCFFQIIYPGLHIHRDSVRNVALNYSLDTGGENSKTAFYEDDGTLVYSEVVPAHQWYLVRTDCPHTVIDQTGPRFAVSAQFYTDSWSAVNSHFDLLGDSVGHI